MPQASTIETSGKAAGLSLAALVLLGTRFTQGFIFWGGATRRLVYDFHSVDCVDKALKLDFDAPGFVAAKLTHALPGALWVQGPIEWTLRHPDLIVASVWLWTIAELAVGLGLMLGLLTRVAASGNFWLNVVLTVIFGWMGSTCLDEWTMAVSGVAMSSAVFLAGGGAWSLDEHYIAPTGWGRHAPWLNWIASGPLPDGVLPKLARWLAGVSIAFTLVAYHMLFGAIVTPLHSRVNFHRHCRASWRSATFVSTSSRPEAWRPRARTRLAWSGATSRSRSWHRRRSAASASRTISPRWRCSLPLMHRRG
jgi:thiosulfate dehydrogenase (quinone)